MSFFSQIGIVGRTGSGKTTLMMALLRIREPEGEVVIDGINVKELGLVDLRRNISVIPQVNIIGPYNPYKPIIYYQDYIYDRSNQGFSDCLSPW